MHVYPRVRPRVGHRMTVVTVVTLAFLVFAVGLFIVPLHSVNSQTVDPRRLDQKIALDLRKVPLPEALQAISQKAGLELTYAPELVAKDLIVTITKSSISVRDAFVAALQQTGLTCTQTGPASVILVKGSATAGNKTADAVGSIVGRVVDSATGTGIAGVTVVVVGTRLTVTTGREGSFAIQNVPAGDRDLTFKLLGYTSVTRSVKVEENRPATVRVSLKQSVSVLSGVVTTATGQQRRIETGNDIAKVNVDSLVKSAPIRDVSDILASRIPGVQVIRSSGAVGSPSRIRIRGVNSAGLSNDPLILVDGFPVNGAVSTTDILNRVGPGTVSSRLDDIDPESIETIEVLRGPSAAALYGSDAANGIIIITTKRGRAGPTRWSATATHDWTGIPGAFPPTYKGWGKITAFRDQTIDCDVLAVSRGDCVQDSVTAINHINDPLVTDIARGTLTKGTIGVNGGVQQMQYNLTVSHDEEMGALKLSRANEIRYRRLNQPVSGDQRRPNASKSTALSGSLTVSPSATMDATVTMNVSQQDLRKNLLETSVPNAEVRDTLFFGTMRPITYGPYDVSNATTRGFGGLTMTWRPGTWFNMTGKLGADLTSRRDGSERIEYSCYQVSGCRETINSSKGLSQEKQTVYSADLGGTANLPIRSWVHSRTTLGLQYSSRRSDGTIVRAREMAIGSRDISTARIRSIGEIEAADIKVGAFISQTMSFAERFFFTASIRRDANSAIGRDASAPSYPKFDMSWLAFDGPSRYSLGGLINSFRARFGYGHAGSPPANTEIPTTFTTIPTYIDGQLARGIVLRGVGNSMLRAERTVEYDGGADLDVLDRRVSLSLTLYRKQTRDALIDRQLGPSAGSVVMSRKENVGKVRNEGIDVMMSARVIEQPGLAWSVTVGASSNANRVVSLGRGVTPFGGQEDRIIEGYPLFSRWRRPVLGYSDRNGDGVLGTDEMVLGDSAMYAGVAQPRYTTSYSTTATIRRFTFNANLGFTGGYTQLQTTYDGWGGEDIRAPISEQAYGVIAETVGNMQTISTLRLNSATLTYEVPLHVVRQLRARSASLSLQGSNLGMWTKYRGKDPDVNGSPVGDKLQDPGTKTGVLPQTRDWSLQVRLGF